MVSVTEVSELRKVIWNIWCGENNSTEVTEWPISMAVLSKAKVCGSSIAGIAGSNSAEIIGGRLLSLFCAV
jgi:hypothetical protein